MKDSAEIAVAGAGSIGCFVGGLILGAGKNVSFFGRQKIADELGSHGLHLTDYTGLDRKIAPEHLQVNDNPATLGGVDIVLVTVKSGATAEIAGLIANHVPTTTVIVSLQNGVRNADVLRELLPDHDVRAGMVPFNVIHPGSGHFHRGTSGNIVVETGTPDVAGLLASPGLEIESSSEIKRVLWGKLLINLNNAVNALSGLTIYEQLNDTEWRRKFAEQMDEALLAMKAAGISPKPPTPLPAGMIPHILRLPKPLFRLVAKKMLTIDPKARTSMAEDMRQGRKTEIEELQGEIMRLGEANGVDTPAIRKVFDEIRNAESMK